MWTAISNPLLLISHVLKRSMDLQQAGATEMNVEIEPPPLESPSPSLSPPPPPSPSPPPPPPHLFSPSPPRHHDTETNVVCCEYVSVERHAEPTPANADWQNQAIEDGPFIPTSSVSSSSR